VCSSVPSNRACLRKRTRLLLFCSLFSILGILLAACGGANNGQGSNTALTIQQGPNGDFTQAFSPYSPSPDPGIQGMVYQPLLYFNQLNGSITPLLASSYQVSNDAKNFTFTIRRGVKWSDGQPFTASDVVFTLDMVKQYPAADQSSLWSVIQSVTAPDDHTVVVTLKKPDAPLLWYLAGQTYIVPEHAWAHAGDPTKFVNSNPIGTGPFKLKTFSPQLIVYDKNMNYWEPGKPQVSEVRYPAYDSNTSLELDLDRGNLDWVGMFASNINQTYVSRDSQHNHYWFSPGNIVALYLNLTRAPFNNVNVRKAISLALDREQMSRVAEDGYEPVANPTGLILPNQQSYLSPAYKSLSFQQNVAQAQQLLQRAGYKKDARGIYADASGKELSFSLNVISGWSDWVTMCQVAASNLATVGIKANVNAIAQNAFTTDLQTGNYDVSIYSVSGGPTPYYSYENLLDSKRAAPVGQTALTNFERWSDTGTDTLLRQYESTTDQNIQKQAIYGLQNVMVDQVPVVPLVYGVNWYEYNTRNFSGWPDQNNQYAVPSPWTGPDNGLIAASLKPVQ
jgi:peptide/nickel transport system substrate-binding protein